MRAVKIDDAEEMLWVVQDEIRRSEEARYDLRLHGVLLVAQGRECTHRWHSFWQMERGVEYWVRRFNTVPQTSTQNTSS